MSTLAEHAKRELELLDMGTEDNKIAQYVHELIKVVESQENDPGVAGLVINTFMTLSSYGLLSPLTGNKDEWDDPDMFGIRRNLRAPNVYKRPDGMCYDSQAKIYLNEAGSIVPQEDSTCFISKFPYMPQPQIIPYGEQH